MGCPDDNLVTDFVDGTISQLRRKEIEHHIDRCPSCRELVSDLASGNDSSSQTMLSPATDGSNDTTALAISVDEAPDAGSDAPATSSAEPYQEDAEPGSDALPALPKGTRIDHFEVLRPLGRGGMGIVYLAQDTSLGRKVALKMISKQLVGSQEAITRFLLEARTTAKFSHQNIVTIHFVGQHEGLPYVALAYLRGETLQERIDRELRLELADALAVAQAIASALAEAHRHGVLHRDLKPDNVHLGRDGHVRVLDFGLAKLFDPNRDAPSSEGFDYRHGDMSMLQTQGAVGTPFYMAPEQWEGAELTGAADIWGWGVIVFAMLAGRLPYEEPSLVSQMTAVCRPKTAPRLSEFATVPPALDDLVAGCLAKDASERPELEALLDAVEQLTIKVPQSRDEETADQNEALVVPVQNSLRWLVAAVVAIGLVIMVVAIVMQSSSPEPETTPAIAAPSIVTAAPSAGATTEPAPLKPSTATATIALSASAPRPPSAITPPRSAAPRLAPPRLAPPPSTTPPPTKEPNWDTPN